MINELLTFFIVSAVYQGQFTQLLVNFINPHSGFLSEHIFSC